MAVIRHEYPILEYSTSKEAVNNPPKGDKPFPRLCLVTFFSEVLSSFTEKNPKEYLGFYDSEMGEFPVYSFTYKDTEFCLIQAVVGSASIATMTDWLYGMGVETILCCGGCGVLKEIPMGEVLLPVRALRDEGASYHYLPPSRFVDLDEAPIKAAKETLTRLGVPFQTCTTWTTDAFYRETADMVEYRAGEGCLTVEMECATMAAVARFRQRQFGQLLYSGDLLADTANYDPRGWSFAVSAREKLFFLTLETLITL